MNTEAQPFPTEPSSTPTNESTASASRSQHAAQANAPEAVQAEALDSASISRCVAASVLGVSHQRAGQPLQDAYAYALWADGTAIIAVADGAGSAAKAEQGSAVAVQAAMAAMGDRRWSIPGNAEKTPAEITSAEIAPAEIDWRESMRHVFGQARAALVATAAQAEAPLRDYATTLLVLVITETHAACGLIGDCAAVIQSVDEELVSLCAPQKGEYANMTNFLTQTHALDMLAVQVWTGGVQNAAVLSDGLLELALNVAQNRPYAPFFAPLFAFAASAQDTAQASAALAEFLNSDRINRRTHDDKTLILLSRGVEA